MLRNFGNYLCAFYSANITRGDQYHVEPKTNVKAHIFKDLFILIIYNKENFNLI